ncbi:hypothetical protein XF36_08905 [Pseudonocardia sp. HH130629-09]|nr:hypothetical protein XF36_08905 [Pseudonocardia sp. HH130629-09]
MPERVSVSKRLLVALSHAIERFALAGADDQPTLVIAMFQRLSYFEREVEMYRRIAGQSTVTVVGLVEELPPALPPGIDHVLLDEPDPLAREWSVTVLSPRSGACLVALDTETVFEDSPTLEAGRRFEGSWSFRREDAYHEVLRLRRAMAGRTAASTLDRIDEVLRAVVASPHDGGDSRLEASMRFVTDRMERALRGEARNDRQLDDAREDDRDRATGARTPAFLHRWTAGGTSGTLPMGLLGIRVPEIETMRRSLGMRAEYAALEAIGQSLRQVLPQRADRAIRIGAADFLLLFPARHAADLARYHDQVQGHLRRCETRYPFVPLHGTAAAAVTRNRPLPVDEVMSAARYSAPQHLPILA